MYNKMCYRLIYIVQICDLYIFRFRIGRRPEWIYGVGIKIYIYKWLIKYIYKWFIKY